MTIRKSLSTTGYGMMLTVLTTCSMELEGGITEGQNPTLDQDVSLAFGRDTSGSVPLEGLGPRGPALNRGEVHEQPGGDMVLEAAGGQDDDSIGKRGTSSTTVSSQVYMIDGKWKQVTYEAKQRRLEDLGFE